MKSVSLSAVCEELCLNFAELTRVCRKRGETRRNTDTDLSVEPAWVRDTQQREDTNFSVSSLSLSSHSGPSVLATGDST